jgi:hypothetical protein
MNALNQAVLRSQTEISLHAVTANRIVLAGPPRMLILKTPYYFLSSTAVYIIFKDGVV